ncbi:MAG: porin [Gammaproteobacteria bacterium]|nr:MAG: porin [Gammaproteobacteria bacterium]PHR84207.1 MAG: porin [Colwellia sp.]
MKLIKNTLALAICSVIALPTFAAKFDVGSDTNLEIYGRADVSMQSSDDGLGGDSDGEGSFTEIKSNASRIGFKGDHKLNDDLKVVFKIEFQVDLDGDSEKGNSITDRNQYVGLKGGFGEVLLGINDTVLKQSQGKVDLFSDLEGDIKVLWKGENRMSDTLTYKSPKFNGFQLGLTYVAEDSAENSAEDGMSAAVFYGDKKLKKSNIYAAIAVDSEVKGYDTVRATIQGKVAGVTLGAIYHTQEKSTDGSNEMDGLMVSAKYSIGAATLKGQYQIADYDQDDVTKTGMTAGVDYKLAKNTKLYAFYTSFDMDSDVSNSDRDYLAAGIQYKF